MDRAGWDFHDAVVAAAGNRRMAEIYETLRLPIMALRSSRPVDAARARASLHEHLTILDAIETGDGALAQARIVEHLAGVLEARVRITTLIVPTIRRAAASRRSGGSPAGNAAAERRGTYMRLATIAAIGLALGLGLLPHEVEAQTLQTVKKRGTLVCGIHGGRAGFSSLDSQGRWVGIDIDTCRAVAAAVLGDASKTEFVKTTAQSRFPMLQTGEVDVLTNNVTKTLLRDTSLGFDFGPITFYDAQGFMIPKALGAKSVKDLDGATVCVAPGSTSEKVVADVFRQHNMQYKAVVIDKPQELSQAFFSGRCDVNVQTTSGLVSQRAIFASNVDDFVLLPEIAGKDPMGPVVRQDDVHWKDIVTWVTYAMIEAEEQGVTSENVDTFLKSEDPNIRRVLGVTPGLGKALGLQEDWAYRVIKQVGNYAEVYERSFGEKSAMKLPRGINNLWTRGGLLYAPPFN
jgi:general L-amino acid transport system substrate-binding protein